MLNEKDVFINKIELNNNKKWVFSLTPILISIALICFNIEPYYVFPITTLYYIVYCKEYSIKKILKYVNWKLILLTAAIILASELITLKSDVLTSYLKSLATKINLTTITGFGIISLISFTISFVLGSSSKYAGIVSMLTSLFGIQYLTYFLTLEFFAYIVSPTHKCVLISSSYFNTPLKDYYKILSIWGASLVLYGITTIVIR